MILEYDNPVLHTNLWEGLEERPWEPLIEGTPGRSWKWGGHDYITTNNTNAFKTGYTLKEYTLYYQFLDALRPDKLDRFKLPLEVNITFIKPTTLDMVYFTVLYKDYEKANLEVVTATPQFFDKTKILKVRGRYNLRTPEELKDLPPSGEYENTIRWSEKKIKLNLPSEKCYEVCKNAIHKLRKNRFRELGIDENPSDLVNLVDRKHESFNDSFFQFSNLLEGDDEASYNYEIDSYKDNFHYDPDQYNPDIRLPGSTIDFDNFETFLKHIDPRNMITYADRTFPKDLYIQFASQVDGKIAGFWVSYPEKPTKENLHKDNVRITMYTCYPAIFAKEKGRRYEGKFLGLLRNKKQLEQVIRSENLHLDFNIRKSSQTVDIVKAYRLLYDYIHKLLGNKFAILRTDSDIRQFLLGKFAGDIKRRGRPRASR